MLIIKLIEVGVNIQNYLTFYTDAAGNMQRMLEQNYVGRCFRGCFIKSILRIVKMSRCVINQNGTPNYGTINVVAEVSAVIYFEGEVICGATVLRKDKNSMICSADIASIIMPAHRALDSIRLGQKIPVIVGAARYIPGADKIGVNAAPFLPGRVATQYKMTWPAPNDATLFADVLERIKHEYSITKEMRGGRAWGTFNQLLYAYALPQKPPGQIVDLMKLISGEVTLPPGDYLLSRHEALDLSEPNIVASADMVDVVDVIEIPAENALLALLEEYYGYLRVLREMVEIYSTEELIKDHANLWLVFRKGKVTAAAKK